LIETRLLGQRAYQESEESVGDPDPSQWELKPAAEEKENRDTEESDSNWEKRRQAVRMIRAVKKIGYDVLQATPNEPKLKTQRPEEKIIKIYVTIEIFVQMEPGAEIGRGEYDEGTI
jgi:hypothetical protein